MRMENSYRVVISERAAQMLVSHAEFLARVSSEAAERLTSEFVETANSLRNTPKKHPWLRGDYIPKSTYRFALFEKRYMLIFQIADDVVYVDYVVDCRQDYQWLLQNGPPD